MAQLMSETTRRGLFAKGAAAAVGGGMVASKQPWEVYDMLAGPPVAPFGMGTLASVTGDTLGLAEAAVRYPSGAPLGAREVIPGAGRWGMFRYRNSRARRFYTDLSYNRPLASEPLAMPHHRAKLDGPPLKKPRPVWRS